MIICPICNHKTSVVTASLPRFVKCVLCEGNFLTKKIQARYPAKYFDEKEAYSFLSDLTSPILNYLLNLKIRYILGLCSTKSPKILDYGCGSGKLLEKLLTKGVSITGYEPSPGALMIAQKRNLPIYSKTSRVKGGYDLITFWHSLEHTHNPFEVISSTRKLLNKDGKILIAVPNGESLEAIIAKDKWFHYSYPLHTIHFTPKSVTMMLKELGFSNIKIDYFNPEYTLTGLVQTFLNMLMAKDVLYSLVAHRRLSIPKSQAIILSLLSIFLLIFFSPILIIFYIIQLIFRRTGAIVVVACKD